ncbi:MAG: hypothetical protein ACU0BS_00610 [Hasllibacter sp.]
MRAATLLWGAVAGRSGAGRSAPANVGPPTIDLTLTRDEWAG